MAMGRATSYGLDYQKGKVAAAKIFALLDRVPLINKNSEKAFTLSKVDGDVDLCNVRFTYPARPSVEILKGLDLHVSSGCTLALVGKSGCGKSTVVQLIERFYDPNTGSLKVDSADVESLQLPWLRSQMSIVSQEPVLFDIASIRKNILYGLKPNDDLSLDKVIHAAREANIHIFIEVLHGYETRVGQKGAELSWGQKQHRAIARALIRNLKIFLLDEATSALDTESEKVVQDALDRAQKGRTCIVIAHRLSTIRNATEIAVIVNGTVAEHTNSS